MICVERYRYHIFAQDSLISFSNKLVQMSFTLSHKLRYSIFSLRNFFLFLRRFDLGSLFSADVIMGTTPIFLWSEEEKLRNNGRILAEVHPLFYSVERDRKEYSRER